MRQHLGARDEHALRVIQELCHFGAAPLALRVRPVGAPDAGPAAPLEAPASRGSRGSASADEPGRVEKGEGGKGLTASKVESPRTQPAPPNRQAAPSHSPQGQRTVPCAAQRASLRPAVDARRRYPHRAAARSERAMPRRACCVEAPTRTAAMLAMADFEPAGDSCREKTRLTKQTTARFAHAPTPMPLTMPHCFSPLHPTPPPILQLLPAASPHLPAFPPGSALRFAASRAPAPCLKRHASAVGRAVQYLEAHPAPRSPGLSPGP